MLPEHLRGGNDSHLQDLCLVMQAGERDGLHCEPRIRLHLRQAQTAKQSHLIVLYFLYVLCSRVCPSPDDLRHLNHGWSMRARLWLRSDACQASGPRFWHRSKLHIVRSLLSCGWSIRTVFCARSNPFLVVFECTRVALPEDVPCSFRPGACYMFGTTSPTLRLGLVAWEKSEMNRIVGMQDRSHLTCLSRLRSASSPYKPIEWGRANLYIPHMVSWLMASRASDVFN